MMEPISAEHRRLLLVELHHMISEASLACVAALEPASAVELKFTPDAAITADERAAASAMRMTPEAAQLLRKLVADSMSDVLFHFFCLMDGVGDPEFSEVTEVWTGVQMAEPDGEDHEMLHDAFSDAYWDYVDAAGEGL